MARVPTHRKDIITKGAGGQMTLLLVKLPPCNNQYEFAKSVFENRFRLEKFSLKDYLPLSVAELNYRGKKLKDKLYKSLIINGFQVNDDEPLIHPGTFYASCARIEHKKILKKLSACSTPPQYPH